MENTLGGFRYPSIWHSQCGTWVARLRAAIGRHNFSFLQWVFDRSLFPYIDALLYAAEEDNLPVCRWILQRYRYHSPLAICPALHSAAKNGNLAIYQCLLDVHPTCFDEALEYAARAGHLFLCQWLCEHYKTNFKEDYLYGVNDAASIAAEHGHLQQCKWLLSDTHNFIHRWGSRCFANHHTGVDVRMPPAIIANGHLLVYQWLMQRFPHYKYVEEDFQIAVRYGRLNFCQWMVSHFQLPSWSPILPPIIRVLILAD